MVMTFLAWLVIDPKSQERFLNQGLNSALICLCIIVACASLFYMRHDNTKKTKQGYLLISFTIATVSTAIAIIGKINLPSSTSSDLGVKVLIMGFIIFIMQFLLSLLLTTLQRIKRRESTFHFKKHFNINVALLGFWGALGCITSWVAIALAPNPAYVTAIGMSAPILLLAFHKWKNIEDKANPIAGTILAISVIALILLQ
jgi:hypothetical protein